MKAIQDYINGNLTDAKAAAKRIAWSTLYVTLVDQYGRADQQARAEANYLKGKGAFREACASIPDTHRSQAKNMILNETPKIIFAYSRKQAIEDGFQIDVSETAREAGIAYPVFITSAVYELCVAIPEGVTCQDERGRLWDVVYMTAFAIRIGPRDRTRLPVALYVRNTNGRSRLVKLVAQVGALDIDQPAPAITIMLPDED